MPEFEGDIFKKGFKKEQTGGSQAEEPETKEPEKMFLGSFEKKIDDKGRIVLPKKFCSVCDKFLMYYTEKEGYPFLVLEPSKEGLAADSQGRILFPIELREKMKFKEGSSVEVLGCGDHIEIWLSEEWEEYKKMKELYIKFVNILTLKIKKNKIF